ncbi:unnamed protein product [Orchesella dallaii]|uniref:F-box domain-containing protein n=1 Tax=Orchesella dallaii TaxID=48710 RepID=A0ABP1RPQ4_9HEXA
MLDQDFRAAADLPAEIWEHVFTFLNHSEKDLLICKNVCTSWARILNKIPSTQNWNPWFFKQHTAGAMLTFRHTPGTLFQSKEDISNFLLGVEQRPSEDQHSNPFINSTLIINWRSAPEYQALHQELPDFFKQHGNRVRKLLYFMHESVPQLLESIPQILQSMSHLRSLIIYSHFSDEKMGINMMKKNSFRFPALPPLKHFCELEIMGQGNLFLLKLFVTQYGQQLRSLSFSEVKYDGITEDWSFIVALCPNLVNLKNEDGILQRNLMGLPTSLALKRLAYKLLCKPYYREYEFSNVMNVIAAPFAATLEMICLDLDLVNGIEIDLNAAFLPIMSLPNFPSLNEFVIPFSFFKSPLLPRMQIEKMKNLKKLTFLDTNEKFQNRLVGPVELRETFEMLWSQLSSSVEEISIRSRQFNSELKRHFPVYHKSLRPNHRL